jgi:uncharacterized protein (DUF58 family)
MPAGMRRAAEAAAARLPALLVAAERVAATVAQGVHGRRRVGQGDAFWQFRRYDPGDTAQSIDWRQSARSEAVFVRENEWEAAESVWLWHDASASMRYRSAAGLPEKGDRAIVLALALAILLVRGGERVARLGGDMLPATGRAAINRIAAAFARAGEDTPPSLPPLEALPRHARLVVIGDLLSPAAEIAPVLRWYAGRGVRGQLVQVVDSAELTLPFRGRVRFEGMEGEGAALIGRVEAVRADYIAMVERHRAALVDLARAAGWGFTVHRTERAPETALLALHSALSQSVAR